MLSSFLFIALAATAAPSSETEAFRRAWASSDYQAACRALEATPQLETEELRSMAEKALARCANEAIAAGRIDIAEAQFEAVELRGLSGEASSAASAALVGWRALQHASKNQLKAALPAARSLPPKYWPRGLDTALLSAAQQALAEDDLPAVKSTVDLLQARQPSPFGIDELKRGLWWATEGERVAFIIALLAFGLLLALTMRSLLRTRRRTRAMLRTEESL